MEVRDIIAGICICLKNTFKECGFSIVVPEGTAQGEFPGVTDGEKVTVSYTGENRALRIEYSGGKLYITGVLKEGLILDGDYANIEVLLLDPETTDEKEIKSLANEISEAITERFSKNAEKKIKKAKMPANVSKSKVENEGSSYDAATLVNRFTKMFGLTEEYKAHYEKYGTLLADDFFITYGNEVVLRIIRENKPEEMKKLFELFNTIYLDGTGDTQSLIVVTILGSLNNDETLLANCTDYMSKDLTTPVIQVNRYLAKSKGAKLRLENPPKYKPKKQKKTLGSRLGM